MKKLILVIVFITLSSTTSLLKAQTSIDPKPPAGMSELEAYSVYLSDYQQNSYDGALKFGRWILKGLPEKIKGYPKFDLETNLNRFIDIYVAKSKKAQNPSLKETYLDSALTVFDKAFNKFSKKQINYYDWYIRKGSFYQDHSYYLDNPDKEAAKYYKKAYDIDAKKFTQDGKGYYMQVLIENLTDNKKKDEALAIMKKTQPYASDQLKKLYNKKRNKLFSSPKERLAFLQQEVKNNPQNKDALSQLRDLYQQQGKTKKANKLSQKLYKLDPTIENTRAMAELALNDARYNEAIKYLKKALKMAENDKRKAKVALQISTAYNNADNLNAARRYAKKAANYNTHWGLPYMKVASIYAKSVSNCTEGKKMTKEDRAVYWLVIDYLKKAKSVDRSVANRANKRIQSYKPALPTAGDIHFDENWDRGAQLSINGSLKRCYSWINEKTTIRVE